MRPEQSTRYGLVAEYYQTFLDWRLRYGLADPCMEELRAALLVECAKTSLTGHERSGLLSLADLISEQQRLVEQAA